MGGSLDCVLKNFSSPGSFKYQGYAVTLCPEILEQFWTLSWPTFQVGWPSLGSFDLHKVQDVEARGSKSSKHNPRSYSDIKGRVPK